MIHKEAKIDENVEIGEGVLIWRNCHVRAGAKIGKGVIIGENVYIDEDVKVGDYSKIQNNALIYSPAIIERGVFIGPGVCLTNDKHPRAITSDGNLKLPADWEKNGVVVREGASIGAGVICVAPLEIGSWSMVGAGAVVVGDIPPHGLFVGSPAHQIGWVNKEGFKLRAEGPILVCDVTKQKYRLVNSSNPSIEIL